jgi:hypothetical protein
MAMLGEDEGEQPEYNPNLEDGNVDNTRVGYSVTKR